jgi:hypothetical protein
VRKISRDWNWMRHISFWSFLIMLTYWTTHDERWSWRRYVVMQQQVLLLPKFGAKSSYILTHFAENRYNSMRNWVFGLPGRVLCEESPWCQRNDEHLTLLFAYLAVSVSVNIDFPCTAHVFFPERLSSHYQGLLRNSFEICTKFEAFPMSNPSRNYIRPDTRLQIKGRKN